MSFFNALLPALEDLIETATGIPAAGVYGGRRAGIVPHVKSEVLIRRRERVSISESGHEDLWVHPIEFEVRVNESTGPDGAGADQQETAAEIMAKIATALDGSRSLSTYFPEIVSVSAGELVADEDDEEGGEQVGVVGSEWTVNGSSFPGVPELAVQTTVVASPTSIASDGVETSTITVTVRDSSGVAVPGQLVVIAASGTGNTLVQAASLTDTNGQVTATLKSTVAETKTITATVNGDAVTDDATVTVALPAPDAILGAKLAAWFDADDASTLSDDGVHADFIVQVDNKVVGGTPASLVAASWLTAPARRATGVNGRTSLEFNRGGSNEIYGSATFTGSPFRIFAVVQPLGGSPPSVYEQNILNLNSGSDDVDRYSLHIPSQNGGVLWRAKQGATNEVAEETSYGLYTGAAFLIMAKEDGTARSIEVDGAPGDTSSSTTVTPSGVTELKVGGRNEAVGFGHRGFDGHLCELVFVDTSAGDITAQQLADLEAYFADKWGITIP